MKKILALLLVCTTLVSGAKNLVYHDARKFPVLGTVVSVENGYTRFPDTLKTMVKRELLYTLGTNTAGMSIRFSSDATALSAKWVSTLELEMNHMTPVGIRGLDLYTLDDNNEWTFVSSVRPTVNKKASKYAIVDGMEKKMREYLLYLPLYDGIDSLYIGIDSSAVIEMPKVDLPRREKPIVVYGTSITQGACASRPGMAYTNILERELNREIYNFGFSGNGQLDMEVAGLMGMIDAGLFIFDCLPNNTAPQLKERIEPFYRYLREKHPNVPVLFIESPQFPIMRYNKGTAAAINAKNDVLKEFFAKLQAEGEKDIYYMNAEEVLGGNTEYTVDNYHFTDLGFRFFADQLKPLIEKYSIK
ncbi:MAG: SGNH/GDSL hydrolase family protein [Muribaculaceae bacterium]|nr:SGNH/GDSL hydrolase family protein [Muribaculaceae bacterium]